MLKLKPQPTMLQSERLFRLPLPPLDAAWRAKQVEDERNRAGVALDWGHQTCTDYPHYQSGCSPLDRYTIHAWMAGDSLWLPLCDGVLPTEVTTSGAAMSDSLSWCPVCEASLNRAAELWHETHGQNGE